jgi:hypothetical protein
MVAVTPCEKAAAKKFHQKLKHYTAKLKAQKCACSVHQCQQTGETTLGEAVTIPDSDITHVFDNEIMLAISHAIEDLAGEVRTGELIATFQRFENFKHQKDRYCSLAQDLDAVRVWGTGTPPDDCPKIDFITADDPNIHRYWLVLFDSPHCRAVLLCKQVNQATTFAHKKFVGFYSFNPYLVQSIRWRFNLLSCGLRSVVKSWEKSQSLPDLKMRDIDNYLPPTRTTR